MSRQEQLEAGQPVTTEPASVDERTLRSGLTAVDLVEMLGAPRMVLCGSGGLEMWTWDHVANSCLETSRPAPGLLTGAGVRTAQTVRVTVRFDADQRASSVAVHAAAA